MRPAIVTAASVAHEPARACETDAAAAAGDERRLSAQGERVVAGHLIANAFGGEATPAGRFNGADVKKHS